jgi:short-subunit dehydrogenase
MHLSGATALVTGGSSGIGAATAARLAAAGAKVVIAGRDPARLAKVAERTGATPVAADLATPEGPARLADAALAVLGRLDLLVSNAGAGWAGGLTELPAAKTAELIMVNLAAPIELTRLLLPAMGTGRQARAVFVASIAGATGVRGEAVYAAAKAGLICFAESLRYELRSRGMGVSVVIPGVIDTPFFERRGQPYQRRWPAPVPADRVARALLSAVERDRDVVYVPSWMRFPAWLHGAAPGLFRALAARFG